MKITFIFDDDNSIITKEIDRSITIFDLYQNIIKESDKEILYMVCGNTILGYNGEEMESRLHKLNFFMLPSQVVNVIIKNPNVNYTDFDLAINFFITKKLDYDDPDSSEGSDKEDDEGEEGSGDDSEGESGDEDDSSSSISFDDDYGRIEVTFVMGKSMKTVSISRLDYQEHLYSIAQNLFKVPILYLLTCSTVVGYDIEDLSAELSCFPFYFTPYQIITVVRKLDGIQYSDFDLYIYNYNKVKPNSINTKNVEIVYQYKEIMEEPTSFLDHVEFITIPKALYKNIAWTVSRECGVDSGDCNICREPILDSQVIDQVACCRNLFHKDCIKKVLTTRTFKCPVCNEDLRDYI
jgi:hypothetical protein